LRIPVNQWDDDVKEFMSNIFLGFSQTFFSGVYATCIGHYVKYGGRG
jgi:hypothetical protein